VKYSYNTVAEAWAWTKAKTTTTKPTNKHIFLAARRNKGPTASLKVSPKMSFDTFNIISCEDARSSSDFLSTKTRRKEPSPAQLIIWSVQENIVEANNLIKGSGNEFGTEDVVLMSCLNTMDHSLGFGAPQANTAIVGSTYKKLAMLVPLHCIDASSMGLHRRR
jgi:hypothetical protein